MVGLRYWVRLATVVLGCALAIGALVWWQRGELVHCVSFDVVRVSAVPQRQPNVPVVIPTPLAFPVHLHQQWKYRDRWPACVRSWDEAERRQKAELAGLIALSVIVIGIVATMPRRRGQKPDEPSDVAGADPAATIETPGIPRS
jgi:hypothetical protein